MHTIIIFIIISIISAYNSVYGVYNDNSVNRDIYCTSWRNSYNYIFIDSVNKDNSFRTNRRITMIFLNSLSILFISLSLSQTNERLFQYLYALPLWNKLIVPVLHFIRKISVIGSFFHDQRFMSYSFRSCWKDNFSGFPWVSYETRFHCLKHW